MLFKREHPHSDRLRASQVRVLVVEDEASAADLMRKLLEARGYEVRAAGFYKEAMSVASTWLPDILVCDIGLPGKSGIDVIHGMRSAYPTLKAIAVSGNPAADAGGRVHDAGFAIFLPKPLNADQLDTAIRQLLADQS